MFPMGDDLWAGSDEHGQSIPTKSHQAMNDGTILQRISELIDEEKTLRGTASTPEEHSERIRGLAHQLDQCWDLLRQRRALEEFRKDPDLAVVRPPGSVEGYVG
jgi:hypothetical protein